MFKNVSPKVIQSMVFIKNWIREKKLSQSTGQFGLHENGPQQINLLHCFIFVHAQQNCFCYSLTKPSPKSVFRSLVSDCFVSRCGTDAFCLYHTAKKTLRVYGALVHIAPLCVCLAVSKDACTRLLFDMII